MLSKQGLSRVLQFPQNEIAEPCFISILSDRVVVNLSYTLKIIFRNFLT